MSTRPRSSTVTVDLVLWPENVVNPEPAPDVGRGPRSAAALRRRRPRHRRTSWPASSTRFSCPAGSRISTIEYNDNFTEAVDADGTVVDDATTRCAPCRSASTCRLRGLVEPFAGDALPRREVLRGTGPAVLDTPLGRVGVSISWEIFFDDRARDAVSQRRPDPA